MKISVIKQNPDGQETWRYTGTVVTRGEHKIVLEAFFDHKDMEIHGMSLRMGDRFLETYFDDRWYNIFEIYDRADDQIKGWYCNISSPVVEKDGQLIYRDYALDLLVFPDGQQIVLDEDEFEALELSSGERMTTQAALAELQSYFKEKISAMK